MRVREAPAFAQHMEAQLQLASTAMPAGAVGSPTNVVTTAWVAKQPSAWMDTEKFVDYAAKVLVPYQKLHAQHVRAQQQQQLTSSSSPASMAAASPVCLIIDAASCHQTAQGKAFLAASKISVLRVPDCCTDLVQVGDDALNRSFKFHLNKLIRMSTNMAIREKRTSISAGETYRNIVSSLDCIRPQQCIKGWKHCGTVTDLKVRAIASVNNHASGAV